MIWYLTWTRLLDLDRQLDRQDLLLGFTLSCVLLLFVLHEQKLNQEENAMTHPLIQAREHKLKVLYTHSRETRTWGQSLTC